MKDPSRTVVYDSGDGMIQVYEWRIEDKEEGVMKFHKVCSLRNY
jgi:hypothetical protein